MISTSASSFMMHRRRMIRLLLFVLFGLLCVGESVGDNDGLDLGGGIVTQTNVERYAALALDLRDMETHIQSGKVNDATNVYMNGHNSGSDATGRRLTLHRLSDDLANLPLNDTCPSFLYQLYGLTTRSTKVSYLQSNSKYADVRVRTYLTEDPSKATTATRVLNMWMYSTYLLYQGLDRCYKRSVADNPDMIQLGGGGMDEFIGLWIGKDQTPGRSDGYGLYTWSQEMGNYFGQNDPESPVNSDLKLLYQEGVTALSFTNACTPNNDDSMPHLWSVAQRMMSKATIPLMQGLIYAIANKDRELTSLYAEAVIPQVVQCRPSVYKRLKTQLLGVGAIDYTMPENIIADLQQVYECLGFTCQDVGSYSGIECDNKKIVPLAEYIPSSDVRDASRIDLDIHQIKILTSLDSYQFAKYLYLYGRNYPLRQNTENDPYVLQSLHKMATTSLRQKADHFYTDFVQYHGDVLFSDKVVLNTLNGEGKYGTRSDEYRYQVITKTIQYQIVHMFVLAQMTIVHEKCDAGKLDGTDGARHNWDLVAAFLIGSLEGPGAGGSLDYEDGQLIWNLANMRAFQFNTMGANNYAVINQEIEALLFAGLGALEAPDCKWFLKVDDDLQHLLLIPIIQSVLRFAVLNDGVMSDEDYASIAAGEVLALAVLPDIANHSETSANLIKESLVVVPGSSIPLVPNGPQEIANAFFEGLDGLPYGCEYIGETKEIDACAEATTTTTESYDGAINFSMVITAFVIALVIGLWAYSLTSRADYNDDDKAKQMVSLVAPTGNINIA